MGFIKKGRSIGGRRKRAKACGSVETIAIVLRPEDFESLGSQLLSANFGIQTFESILISDEST